MSGRPAALAARAGLQPVRQLAPRLPAMIRHGRRRRLVLAAALSLWLPGCATTVIPPETVAEPARIGLLDHGHHASLILESDDGSMVRYAYGDWQWYALGRTGVLEGIAALLWPTPAGLGRRQLPGPFSPAAVERGVGVPIEDALYLVVDGAYVRRLTARLDRIFQENAPRQTNSELRGMVFVPHPEPYSILHNSNRLVAEWLEDLGCRVEGPTILSDWQRG